MLHTLHSQMPDVRQPYTVIQPSSVTLPRRRLRSP